MRINVTGRENKRREMIIVTAAKRGDSKYLLRACYKIPDPFLGTSIYAYHLIRPSQELWKLFINIDE